MKLTFDFSLLVNRTKLLITTLKSSVSAEKNLVFRLNSDLSLDILAPSTGVNTLTSIASDLFTLDLGDTVVGDGYLFMLPAGEFNNFLTNNSPTSISTPLDITIEPLTEYKIKLHLREELVESEDKTVIKEQSYTVNTKRVDANVFSNLESIRAVSDDSVEFMRLDEESEYPYLVATVTDMSPYVNNKTSQLIFDSGYTKVFTPTMLVRFVNRFTSMIETGEFTATGLGTLREIVNSLGNDFYFYNDTELGSLVIKSEDYTVGILYNKKVMRVADLLNEVDVLPYITLSRSVLELYLGRMRSISSNLNSRVSLEISKDVSDLRLVGSELETDIDILGYSSTSDDVVVSSLVDFLGGRKIELTLGSLSSALFGKSAYADDICLGFWSKGGKSFVKFFDSTGAWEVLVAV